MGRLLKWLIILAGVGGLLLAASYMGARATVGKLLGSHPPEMGQRTVRLPARASNLRGEPIVWQFVYGPTAIPGAQRVRVWVSLTGDIVAIQPADLRARLDRYYDTRLP